MSDYKRLVSYFYRYEKGEKKHNVGFARLECLHDSMRLNIQIQDKNNVVEGSYDVFLYDARGQIVQKIQLGRMVFANQKMSLQCSSKSDNVLGSGSSIDSYEGIIICFNGQLYYATQWSDNPVDVDKIAENSSFQKVMNNNSTKCAKAVQTNERNVDKFTELCEKIGEISENYRKIQEINKKITQNVDNCSKNEENVDKHTENEDNLRASEVQDKENVDNREKKEDKIKELKVEDEIREDKNEKEADSGKTTPLTGIAYLLKHRSKLPDFRNHEVMQCVKIMPEDIGYMSRSNWEYGNNSFVMHGFYNYRYLLLGCMHFQDGKKQYVLGVPGIYSNKDKYLAEIFKFGEFVPVRNCPYKTGEFGYWLGRLSE